MADVNETFTSLVKLLLRDGWGSRRLEVPQPLSLFLFKANGPYWASVEHENHI